MKAADEYLEEQYVNRTRYFRSAVVTGFALAVVFMGVEGRIALVHTGRR